MSDSFEETFATEFRPLYRYLRRRVGANDAEDLAEATLSAAYANWEKRDPERPVRPWLYGIAANLMRHHWRSEQRMLRAYARSGVDPVLGDDEAVVEPADVALRYRPVALVLAKLRPQERELLLLHAWAGLTDHEIASALGIPVGTVKSRLHRTLARVRNQLDASGQVKAMTALPVCEERP